MEGEADGGGQDLREVDGENSDNSDAPGGKAVGEAPRQPSYSELIKEPEPAKVGR